MNNFRLSASTPLLTGATTKTNRILLTIPASLFVGLCAHISFPLPFTPVPTTLQTFAVLLVGLLMGPAESFGALVLYLAEGAAGIPVFSPQGLGGPAQLIGPTAGYLFAYPVAALFASVSLRALPQRIPSLFSALMASVIAYVPIFGLGCAWLAYLLHTSGFNALELGLSPFIAAEAIKLTAVVVTYVAVRNFRQHS